MTNIDQAGRSPRRLSALAAACLASCLALAGAATQAQTFFNGVAAGDPTADGAILWTRTSSNLDGSVGRISALTAQIATDDSFSTIVKTLSGSTSAAFDYTLKLDATGLAPGGTYYYRFTDAASQATSAVGRFTTAPAANVAAPIKFAFSGDADGNWRPYSSVRELAAAKNNFFVFLGDTIYETASAGSPAAALTTSNVTPATLTADYNRKYREQLVPTTAGGFNGLQTLYAGQANYTLLDNHELGNLQYQAGGAPQGSTLSNGLVQGLSGADPANDVNRSGQYMNKTAGFQALTRAYANYQPIRETLISAPGDARSDGTLQLYNSQQWGKNLMMINVDDRSYRDIRLSNTGDRANNAERTMLGATELGWLKTTLRDAQANGVTWKVISVSSPMDQLGAIPSGNASGSDSSKSWIGGYRAERNALLKFIADEGIRNVVFLSTDDHQSRVNELTYDDNGTTKVLANAFSIVAGPIGAGGPDGVSNHSFANIANLANSLAASQTATGVNPIGLDPAMPGLKNVHREGDPNADTNRSAVDFFSPDTFNYTQLAIDADGTLSVDLYGINSYAAGSFPEPSDANPVRNIFGFQVSAAPVPEPGSWALMLAGGAGLVALRRRRRA